MREPLNQTSRYPTRAAAGVEDGFVTSKLESIQDVGAPRGVWLRNAVVGARIPVAVGAKRHHARLTEMALVGARGVAPGGLALLVQALLQAELLSMIPVKHGRNRRSGRFLARRYGHKARRRVAYERGHEYVSAGIH